MKTNYNIKNFRVFGEEGAEAKIAPFTVLTGCNSSGKSSIAKSILLLDTFLQKVKAATNNKSVLELGNYTMDFNNYPLNLLGRFDKVINSNSTNGEIEYRFTSENNLEVVLIFVSNTADILNRGYLKSLMILKEGITVFNSGNGLCSLNTIPFLNEYLRNTRKNLAPNHVFAAAYTGFDAYEYEKNHKVYYHSVMWAIENNSLFNVPILDKIGYLNKNDFKITIEKLLASAYNDLPGIKAFIDQLSKVFIESNCASFGDFFKLREKEWMSTFSNSKKDSIDPEESSLVSMNWSNVRSDCTIADEVWIKIMKKLGERDETLTKKLIQSSIKFPFLLTTLTNVGEMIGLKMDKSFSAKDYTETEPWYDETFHITTYYMWEDFTRFVNKQLEKALNPSWTGNLTYVGSSRIDVKRLYTLDANSDFAALLNRYFNTRRDFVGLKEYENEKGYEPDAFMNKWLNEFGVCDYATIDLDHEGLGVTIKLHKGNRTSLLADEGYGITQLFSILMEIETSIQNAFHHFLVKGWYGQNYIYTTDMNTNKVLFPEQTIIIEEPEIHLHPKYQSLLVDMFAEALEKYNIHFIIETHSEYFIRRLQVRVAEKKVSAENVSVIYVDEDSHPYNMGLKENGKFSQDFGPGFLDEADSAAIRLFDLSSE